MITNNRLLNVKYHVPSTSINIIMFLPFIILEYAFTLTISIIITILNNALMMSQHLDVSHDAFLSPIE